jgi:hypothetical protein|tara:strand:- start:1075 stop:2022 length:948 start_codon:yes stop_codon:yes gene_type:complete
MSEKIIISTNKKNNVKKNFKIDFNLNINNSPKMSLSSLNNDILIKIIENITEEKNKQIKKLQEELETSNNTNYEYQQALMRTGSSYYICWECNSCIIDLDEEDMEEECYVLRDNNDGEDIICCNCMEKINNNTNRQNEIMEEFTKYIVRVKNNNYPSCWNKYLEYKTYEEIPMCYKTSNMCIEKHYYNDWEEFKKDEEPKTEIINGNKNNSYNHLCMISELEDIININDIYLHSIIQVHKPKNRNEEWCCGYYYDSDIWYRSVPIKTLINVKSCGCEGEGRPMIGRSWYKCEGYTCSKCAYNSLIRKYKKKYLTK